MKKKPKAIRSLVELLFLFISSKVKCYRYNVVNSCFTLLHSLPHACRPYGKTRRFCQLSYYSHGKDKSHIRFLCTESASPISSLPKNEMNILIHFFGLRGGGGGAILAFHILYQVSSIFMVIPNWFFFNCVFPIPAAIGVMNVVARSPLNSDSVKRWNLPSK